MSIRKLILILFVATPLVAQEPKGWQIDNFYAEVGKLHVQVAQLTEYVTALKARIAELEAENAKLKEGK